MGLGVSITDGEVGSVEVEPSFGAEQNSEDKSQKVNYNILLGPVPVFEGGEVGVFWLPPPPGPPPFPPFPPRPPGLGPPNWRLIILWAIFLC